MLVSESYSPLPGLAPEGFFDSWQCLIEGLLSERHYLGQWPVAKLVEPSRKLQRIDWSLRSLQPVFDERLLRLHRSHDQCARLISSPTQWPWRHPAMTHPGKWQAPIPDCLGRKCHPD